MTGIITNKIIRDMAKKPEAEPSGAAGIYSIKPRTAGRISRLALAFIINIALIR